MSYKIADIEWDVEKPFCLDLPSTSKPEIGKIFVTGATGYVGGRLVPELLERGYKVRVMVRLDPQQYRERWPQAEILAGDASDRKSLSRALEGVHTAYYLIHSLCLGPDRFEATDINLALNFQRAAEEQRIKRIIYLGGLGDIRTKISAHLQSRMGVSEVLMKGKVPATVLRAAIIIGSGSASYEIINHLARKIPLFLIPEWAETKCQPISIRDVIKYLVGVLETPRTTGKSFDIGGPDILSYREILKISSELLGRKPIFISSPVSSIRLFSYIVSFFTPVPAPVTLCLVHACKDNVVCDNQGINSLIPFQTIPFKEALIRAMNKEERDEVRSSWKDAYPPSHVLSIKLSEFEKPPEFTKEYSIASYKQPSSLFNSICKIGGREGWFHNNWMWRLRGMLDEILMGVGISRGRRSHSNLRIHDVIDFWRVEDMVKDRMLLLRAEMKLPGKAWLAFYIQPLTGHSRLSVKAFYQPVGFLGRLYWYTFLPFHNTIFNNLIRQIDKRS